MWTVYDTEKNIIISKLHYRKSALILAKSYLKDQSCVSQIADIDKTIFKHQSDISYYEHSIKTMKNTNQIAVREARLCDSEHKLKQAEHKMMKYLDFA